MSLSYGHIPQHLCSVSRYAIDKGKTRLPIKKRTPIKALKVLNDQRPQVLPSGQNIHVRFACLYHTMIHLGKKVPFLSPFCRLFLGFFSALQIKKVPINMDTLVLLFPKRIAFRINILLKKSFKIYIKQPIF